MKRVGLLSLSLLLAFSFLSNIPISSAAGTNLIQNPSVEQATAANPASWSNNKWGTNTTTFSYDNTGHTGTKSVSINMASRSSGDAKWIPVAVPVAANTSYTFTDWYKSSVKTSLDAVITTTANKTTYKYLGNVAASADWKQASFTFKTPTNAKQITIIHYIDSVGQLTVDDFNLELTNSTTPTPTPTPTPTAPTVQISNPAAGATASGTAQTISANATSTDSSTIIQVQFKLDGANLGVPDTSAPYSVAWDTTLTANGSHSLTAVATTSAAMSTTSSAVSVNVQNTAPTPTPTPTPAPPSGPNLVPNPSLETSSNGTTPDGWLSSNWGTNTATFSYPASGHTGSRSVRAEITSYTNGAANWYYPEVAASAGKTYKYENWYQSNVDTEVDAQVTMNDGTVQYFWLGTVFANTNWTKYTATFTVPAGAKSISIYQILAKKGYLVTDDYSLAEYTPTPFNRGLVSVTFDDGWINQYTNALPILQKYSIPATFYIISGELNNQPDYMSGAQVKNLYSLGMEIGSHSVTHSDMTTLSSANLTNEFASSKNTLQTLIGAPVTSFAYPYGAYNAATINTGKQYYQSQRTVKGGLNTKDTLDITALKIYEVDSNISRAQVQGWIDAAISQKAWLILVYHEVATTPIDPSDALYTAQPADFDWHMNYLKSTGVKTLPVNQALNEVLAQP